MTDDRDAVGRAPLLEMHGIVKTFPGVRALDGVDLDVRAGEVHCLLGQNGAGKSTLIKVLAGAHQPDDGHDHLARASGVTLGDPQAAMTPGHRDHLPGARPGRRPHRRRQHLPGPRALAVGHHPPGRRQPRRRPQLLTRLGHPEIRPAAEVGSLSAASQQMVSMARALSQDAKLIIMDEPSAVLDNEEVERLFARHPRPHRPRRRRRLHLPPPRGDPPDRRPDHRAQGRADRRHRAAGPRDLDPRGHHADDRAHHRVRLPGAAGGPAHRRARCSRSRGWACAAASTDVSLRRPPGRDRRPGRPGRLRPLGDPRDRLRRPPGDRRHGPASPASGCAPATCGAAVAAGIGLAPEERKSQALLLDDSVYRNITVSSLGRFARGGFLSGRAERSAAREQTESAGRPSGRRRPRSSAPCRAATSRRSCWPAGCCATAGSCCSTSRPAASTSARARRSTRWSATSPTAASPSSWSPARSRRCSGLADRVLVVADGARRRRGAGRRARRAPRARPGHGRHAARPVPHCEHEGDVA